MKAAIVVVGFRAYDELDRCLASIARHDPDTPVVVVDHQASATESARLRARYPGVRYEPRERNPGFGAGVNDAARLVPGAHLVLLNPDCELTGPLASPLLGVLDEMPRVGIAGALVRESDGRVQASARRFPDVTTGLGGRTSWLSRVVPDNPLTRRNLTTDPDAGIRTVDWVSGACMAIRRDAFDALGGFDERFFLYWEDADLCRRAAAAGWTTVYAPVAEVVHVTGRASRHAPTRSRWAFHRSALRYYWKHGSPWARVAAPVVAVALAARFVVRSVRG
ncbi:MAG: glycosyltransferase family 2 protein [Vicinamibacterales bacterium]